MSTLSTNEYAIEPCAAPACRQCGSPRMADLGALPDRVNFAGQALAAPLAGGRLYRCSGCRLVMRSPILPSHAYEALYATSPANVWSRDHARADQRQVLDALVRHVPRGAVLDVGCFDGFLLGQLGAEHQRFGIEASANAAAVAASRGVKLIGQYLSELDGIDHQFDAITCVDVIEHVARPLDLLASMARRLAPRGRIVISTGDADSPAWRRLGALFWYCAPMEHLSFIDESWCRLAAHDLQLEVTEVCRFRYDFDSGGALASYLKLGIELLAAAGHRVAQALRLPVSRPRRGVGRQGLFKDHLLVVMTKPPDPAFDR